MSSAPGSQPTFTSIVPPFVVSDLEQALAFYGQLGFQTSIYDEHFAFAGRDEVTLQTSPRRVYISWQ
jgi:hypothetical protein